ncbi:MAG TPA: insulinase family protein [Draconibacterium sp.]|nr:insulinase family protein [Draconibacterium sp.]
MKLILSLLLLCSSVLLSAQANFDLKDKIPQDPKVSKGVLENGMTYYVRSNENPKNRAELFLVVRAGSVDEDDDQQGLAHFCEHMSFNGTKNFPKHELINYFESIGMEFGPEINAYTSFDETVYMLKVPLDSSEYIEKGLQVLFDWASQNTDSDEEINNERGVIHEEWRMGKDANERMQQKWLPVFLHDSKYAERLPIGKMEIVDNCPPDALRRFRKDWYRPDLQAVIVVGDFNQDEMVKTVKEKFSAIPAAKNPRAKKYFEIPDHKETLVSINTDKEAQYPLSFVFYKHPLEKSKTLGDYRESIMEGLYNGMINNRLSEKLQQAEPPFLMAQSSYSTMFGPKSVYQSVAVANNGKIEEGLKAVLIENERVRQFGFTETELERQKTALLNGIEKSYNERNNQKSINFANEYKRNFLMTEEPFPGIENEFEYFKAFLPTITADEINALADKWVTDENRVVVVAAPEIEGVKVPGKEEIFAVLDDVKTMKIEPYEDAVSNVPLVEYEPSGSKVVSEKKLENVEAVEWTLENGATVIVKKTDFKEDEILFNAWSLGGNSLYPLKDDVSADFATDLIELSGIAGFDKIALDKLLSNKVFSISPSISQLRESFNGSSSVKDVETLLQMLYLYFTELRFDQSSYQSLMARMAGILENKSASPESAFQDTMSVTMANYNERARPLTKELLSEADFNRMKQIAKERFKNAADFKFFFVGNINIDEFKPLVEKYIGGIPSVPEKENWVDLGIEKPKGIVDKVVKRGQEDKSTQYIVFHGDFDFNSQNQVQLDAVSKILSTRLLEVIREDKSSVYSIGAYDSSTKFPEEEYTITVAYGTAPQKLDELKKAVFDIIDEYKKNGPTAEEVAKAQEKMIRERETAVRENRYWLSVLSNTYYLKDGDFSEYGNYDKLVKNLTTESTKKAFNNWFDFKNYVSVALAPEK